MSEIKKIIIKSGDTLSGLAKEYHTTVAELMKINTDIKDPNLIIAGHELNINFDDHTSQSADPITINSADDYQNQFNQEETSAQVPSNVDVSVEAPVETMDFGIPQSNESEAQLSTDSIIEQLIAAAMQDDTNQSVEVPHETVQAPVEEFVIENPTQGQSAEIPQEEVVVPEAIEEAVSEDSSSHSDNYYDELLKLFNDATDDGKWSTKHNCATFVKRQLYALELLKEGSYGHGKDQAENIAGTSNIAEGYKAIGKKTNNASQIKDFEDLIAANGGTASNIIISFAATGSFGGRSEGHSVFVYKIDNGMVYFLDDFGQDSWGTKANTPNALTIEQFENTYLQKRNNVNFITQIVPEDSPLLAENIGSIAKTSEEETTPVVEENVSEETTPIQGVATEAVAQEAPATPAAPSPTVEEGLSPEVAQIIAQASQDVPVQETPVAAPEVTPVQETLAPEVAPEPAPMAEETQVAASPIENFGNTSVYRKISGNTTMLNSMIDYLRGKGFNDVAIAGIIGNSATESCLDLNSDNPDSTAYGLFQWLDDRYPSNWEYQTQMDHMMDELSRRKYGRISLFDALNSSSSPGNAADIFREVFEGSHAKVQERRTFASELYDNYIPYY